jgi:hypothetical protein
MRSYCSKLPKLVFSSPINFPKIAKAIDIREHVSNGIMLSFAYFSKHAFSTVVGVSLVGRIL